MMNKPDKIQLHCFGESGHSYKVALAMNLAGVDWEPIAVDFFNGATRGSDFTAQNEMGECPVLQDGDLTLTQSGVILEYLSDKTGQFGVRDAAARREVMRWVLWDNHKCSSLIGMLRFMMNFAPVDKRSDEVIAFLSGRVKTTLKVLNAHLDGRSWMVGDLMTSADFSCCGYLYYPEDFGFDRAQWPHIDRWLDKIAALPGWAHPYDLMPRAFRAAT